MSEVLFMIEPESRLGRRWYIRQGGSIRTTYDSRAQAVMDARQLASFESELRGRIAIVRVLDADRRIAENLVCGESARAPDRRLMPISGAARLAIG